MPNTVYKDIEKLQKNPDYGFDEVPMPYDITIVAAGAGTLDVDYSVVPARNNTPLTPSEMALWRGTQPIRELQAALNVESGSGQTAKGQAPTSEDEGPVVGIDMPA